jgi:hypothetical protein
MYTATWGNMPNAFRMDMLLLREYWEYPIGTQCQNPDVEGLSR